MVAAALWRLSLAAALGTCQGSLTRIALSDGGRAEIIGELRARRDRDPEYSVIELGPSTSSWTLQLVDALAGRNEVLGQLQECWPTEGQAAWAIDSAFCCEHQHPSCFDPVQFTFERCCHAGTRKPRKPWLRFALDLADPQQYKALLDHVEQHGKFDFALCAHALPRLSRPQTLLDMLPKIAKEGFLAVPSKFKELSFHEVAEAGMHYRGAIGHRWFFSTRRGMLVGFPKVSFIDVDPHFDEFADSSADVADLSMRWSAALPYEMLNGDVLAADVGQVMKLYHEGVEDDDFGRSNRSGLASSSGIPGCRCDTDLGAAQQAQAEVLKEVCFMTYVSPRKTSYIDGAVMLGLSLQRHAPGIKRYVLLEETASPPIDVEAALYAAGWEMMLTVPAVHPRNAPKGIHFDGVYTKVLMFNPEVANYYQESQGYPFKRIIFLDADTWVRSPRILELASPSVLKPWKPLAAVMDASAGRHPADHPLGTWNSGVMVFRPDLERFKSVFQTMMAGYTNDQPAINEAYDGDVAELSPVFNFHAHLAEDGKAAAEDAVVVHFTGSPKPTHAAADHLRKVRDGVLFDRTYGLRGAERLYSEYFAAMASDEAMPHLSQDLQRAILETQSDITS